jgi:dolichol-phosphate mannosyltransferase
MSAADRGFVQKMGKFLVVGASGVVVNNAALFTFYQLLRCPLLVASSAAVALAVVNNFIWNDRWTFEQHEGPLSVAMRRFVRFGVASSGGLVLTTLMLWVLVNEVGLHYLVANLIAAATGAASNYVVNARWTYGQGARA